jgi:hypothetical protein
MKYLLLTLVCTLALTACGDCVDNAPEALTLEGVTPVELPVLSPVPPTVIGSTVVPATVTPEPEPVQVCPESNTCSPSPAPLPPNRVPSVVTPSPEPVCIRDSSPLVDMGNYLIDNCGNKYGKTN